MKHLIFDANNIASISFYRARSLMMEDIESKLTVNNEEEYCEDLDEMKKNITGFAIHLFLNKVYTIINYYKDRKVFFIWDGRYGSLWRKKANTSYKANRVHDENFYSIFINMMNTISDLLKNYPVTQLTKENAEADDLIYSLVKILESEEITVVSTDSDMIQLAQQFNNVNIWNPISKKYHIIPEYNYVVFKSVVGDKSDNIDGVPKYGNVKGKKIAVGGLELLSEEYRKIVEENIKIIDLSKNPFEAENTLFVQDILNNYKSNYDVEQIKKIFFDLKLKQQLDKFSSTMSLIKSLQ